MQIPNPFNPLIKLDREILDSKGLGILGVIGVIFLEGLLTSLLLSIPTFPTISSSLNNALIKIVTELVITLFIIYFLSIIFFVENKQAYSYSKLNFNDIIFSGLIILGLRLVYSGSIDHITSSMVMPKYIEDAFKEISINPIYFLFSVAILAPIKEEFLYRGIIFNGLAKRYPYGIAIIISSFFFGIAHLNIPQGINAFFIGIVISYIYYHTKSFYLCIFMHFFNNVFVSTVAINTSKDFIVLSSISFVLLGLLFLFFGFKNLNLKERLKSL